MFESKGSCLYLGEDVTMADHMLQSANVARKNGASDYLVTAALLHDIGLLVGDLPEEELMNSGQEKHHAAIGAKFLKKYFPPAITELVRLHISAKRYLCSTDKDYVNKLSAASVRTYELQGGAMSEEEIAEFEACDYADDAVRLRKWEDEGKVDGIEIPAFQDFRKILERCVNLRKAA